MRVYEAKVVVHVDDDMDFEDLKKYLEDAVALDLDTEEYGSVGVASVEIQWDSLRPS